MQTLPRRASAKPVRHFSEYIELIQLLTASFVASNQVQWLAMTKFTSLLPGQRIIALNGSGHKQRLAVFHGRNVTQYSQKNLHTWRDVKR